MKRVVLLTLAVVLVFSLFACSTASDFETDVMPEPFSEIQGVGGGVETAPFYLLTENGEGVLTLNDISYDIFVSEDDFFARINEEQAKDYFHTPQTSISEYPNLYSFIIKFEIPVDKVREYYEGWLRLNEEVSIFCLPKAGIDVLCTLDEAKILEYFVSDYAIYVGGDKAYSPAWVYYHTPEDYRETGITPEMLEAKREIYNKLPLTEEALAAFNDKIGRVVDGS